MDIQKESESTEQKRYFNRELSWLQFNARVLREARNVNHPLLERLRFVAISGSNIDEFYSVRVAGVLDKVDDGITDLSVDGMTPLEQLHAIKQQSISLFKEQEAIVTNLLAELRQKNFSILTLEELNQSDKVFLKSVFMDQIFPILTPLALDPSHPFPLISHLGFSLILKLQNKKTQQMMQFLLPVPSQLPRFWKLPSFDYETRFIALEDILHLHFNLIFADFKEISIGTFKIVRDSYIEIDGEFDNVLTQYERALNRRRYGVPVLLKISSQMSDDLKARLAEAFDLDEESIIMVDGLIDRAKLSQLIIPERHDLVYSAVRPVYPEYLLQKSQNIFDDIRKKDILLHHPFEAFDIVIDFLQSAAKDPNVVSIKQMLYRTSLDSPIVKALIEAAGQGKAVTALIEIKARFDEEANIRWARDLERAGVHVIYGFRDLKTHAKVTLVTRREHGLLNIYTHFGTGNYHAQTAKLYTDLSLLTANPSLGRDAVRLFNYTTGYIEPNDMEQLIIAPLHLKNTLISNINDEIEFAKQGLPATIWAKMNSLVDPDIINKLYEASKAGVVIKLIIRGICCLRPSVQGLSENIEVRSVVGRFLEHSRIIAFGNGHILPSVHAKLYISSADWMPRNLNRRVETLVPILDADVHNRILGQIFTAYFSDNEQSWILQPDGDYTRPIISDDSPAFNVQNYFLNGI